MRLRIHTLIMLMLCAVMTAWGETVTYTISAKNQLTTTGTVPNGSTATIKETGNISVQMTEGNSQTLTLSGFNGLRITQLKLNMRSNQSTGSGKLLYSIDGGNSYTYIIGSSTNGLTFKNTEWYGSWSDSMVDVIKNVNIIPSSNNLIIKIEATSNSLYCKSYTLTYEEATSSSVTLNSFGFATYASTHPLDFSNASDYTAWQITGVSGNVINFQQITGAVAAGTGVFLKGTAGESVEVPFASMGDKLNTNKLVGITTATKIASGDYYGLSGSNFVKVNAGTVPAGKALLPVEVVGEAKQVKALMFVFDHIDGVRSIETVSAEAAAEVFNLAGQRISSRQPGINIINGKKVLVK